MQSGILYGIGVGPGDPELITLKAVKILRQVDVVFAAASTKNSYSLAMEIVAPHLKNGAPVVRLGFPMTRDKNTLNTAWKENADKVVTLLKEGRDAAMITLGDPMTYSTFGYVMHNIKEGYPDIRIRIVPGITSYHAGAAAAGHVLAEAEESFTVISGALGAKKLKEVIGHTDSVVILKVYKNYEEIIDTLNHLDLADGSVLISRCGLDGEEVIRDLKEGLDIVPSYLSLLLIRKNGGILFLYTFLALLAGCAFMSYWSGALDTIPVFKEQARLWERVIWPLMRLTGSISIGLFIGLMVEGMGWTERLAVMARPFMRWGHLPSQMGAVFTTAFFSGTASLSMLMSFYQEGSLNRREVTLAVLLNTFPSFFLHLPTTFFIILALMGKAGAIYLCLTFVAALLRLITIVTCSHFVLPLSEAVYNEKIFENKNWKGMALEAGKKLKSRLGKMLMIILPVYLIIVLVSDMGFFSWLRKFLVHGITGTLIPIEAMSIVIFSLVAEFTSGYAAAGAMLDAGTLNTFQTVLALLLGNIIAAPVRALRHQVPYYMGIFSPGLGTYLMLISQAFRIVSLMAVGLIFIIGVNILG